MSNHERVPRVLMLGPSLDSHGGMSSFASAVLAVASEREDICINYMPTVIPGTRIQKLRFGMHALCGFKDRLDECDVVHVNYASGFSMLRKRMFVKIARQEGKTVILHSHGSAEEEKLKSGDKATVQRLLSFASNADALIAISDEWKEIFVSAGIPAEKIFVLRNGVRLLSDGIEKSNPASGERVNILYLGRLEDEKGLNELFESVRLLEHRIDPERYRLIVAGAGNDQDVARYKSAARSLQSEVCFTGWVQGEAKDALTRAADIFVLPSHNEVLPMSLLEAMGAGAACIATSVGAIPTVIRNGVNGLLVNPGNALDLSDAMAFLLLDDDERQRVSAAGVDTVSQDYSVSATVDRLVGIYEKVSNV